MLKRATFFSFAAKSQIKFLLASVFIILNFEYLGKTKPNS